MNRRTFKRGSIDVSNHCNGRLQVSIEFENDTIWLTEREIANLLGIYIQNVSSNIRAVFKRGELNQCDVERYHKGLYYYNFSMLISLIFKVRGGYSQLFRNWVERELSGGFAKRRHQTIFIQMSHQITES
ncbi:MAG: hypothetical protein R3Y68_10015 [Rikenellaceae bacterium]